MEKKLSNKKFRIFIFSILSLAIVVYPFMMSNHVKVNATSSISALQQQYNDLQNLINQNQQQINNNNNNIQNLQAQVNSYQQLIFQKEVLVNNEKAQVDQLNSQIAALNAQILSEQNQINVIKGKIDQNAKSGYEETYIPPVTIFMGNSNINSDIASVVYFKATITHENDLVVQMDKLISSLNTNKASVQLKQQDAQSLYNQELSVENSLISDQNALKNEQASFANQNSNLQSSNNSLSQQQQSVLTKIGELSLQSGTPGVLPLDVPCQQGAYYSQECSQWGNDYLAGTNYTYSGAGCSLIAAIIAENLIGNTQFNPYTVNNSTYWTNNGGAIFQNFPGRQYSSSGNSSSINLIDTYASPSSPVVVGIKVTDNKLGMHFITMTGPIGASGTMQDPWFGPNLTFGQDMGGGIHYYSSEIFAAIVF